MSRTEKKKGNRHDETLPTGKVSSPKVFVGLSGGVDSSVSAALLKQAGYNVTGVFIKVWQPDFLPCSWREERRDAMRVAAKLGIPFLTFDLEKEYKRDVLDYMIREYKAGRTPNPDVMCNKYVKFGAFFKKARKMGANYVATGHYSKVKSEKLKAKSKEEQKLLSTTYNLLTAADATKDQSYFLWTLNQETLSKTLFPIGGYKKNEVRALAKRFGLFTSEKKDSQGLCFVGKLDMKEFLSRYIKPKRGEVLNEKGKVIGHHDGSSFFTLGERRGFTVVDKNFRDKPLFVISKDVSKNTITVKAKNEVVKPYVDKQITLSETNWILGKDPDVKKKYLGRPRYRAELVSCKLKKNKRRKYIVSLCERDDTIAPGQSFVLYDKEVCLGGGVID